jgi:hypothetical protein
MSALCSGCDNSIAFIGDTVQKLPNANNEEGISSVVVLSKTTIEETF